MSKIKEFFKKLWISIKWGFKNLINKTKEKIKEKKENFHFSWIKFGIFVFIIILLVVLFIIIKSGVIRFPEKEEYDKTGFVSSSEINKNSLVLENENYKFDMDTSNTHFTYTDKTTSLSYKSYRTNEKQDTLTVYYSGSKGVPVEMSNYKYSINYEGEKRYAFREGNNSIEVLYYIGGKIKINYTDLPELISAERFNYYIDNVNKLIESGTLSKEEESAATMAVKTVKASYIINEKVEKPYYKLDNPINLSSTYVTRIYNFFYKYGGYTEDDLKNDCLENGVELTKVYPTFEIAIRYELENDGLKITLVNESIVDYETSPLVYVDVLPYFGAADSTQSGYALIPDGSGVLLDFNSNRSYANYYEARIYGDDKAKNVKVGGYNVNKINFGVYGLCYEEESSSNGFINIIEQGAESCSIIGKMNTKGINEIYFNQVFYRFFYRECDTYEFSSLSGANTIKTWTNDYNSQELICKIKLLNNDASYSQMAKKYQEYLINNGDLAKSVNELTLNLTLIGGYLEDTNFLGIPYQKVVSLTNSEEALEIAKELKDEGIDNINLIYKGFFNDGINQKLASSIDYNSMIASKSDLKELANELEKLGIKYYPNFRLASGYTTENIKSKDQIRDMYGKTCPHYAIDEATFTVDKETTPLYYVKPETYSSILNKVKKSLNKTGANGIAIEDLGNVTYGSYKNKETLFRSTMVTSYEKLMESLNDYSVISNEPNDYALRYSNVATNIPYSGTNYQIVAASVPFYQLVISGYVNYSGISMNLNDEHSFDYYKMKTIETLSSISMTWTANDTVNLIYTEYDYYYSTYYKNWFNKTVQLYNELKSLDLYSSSLNSHVLLDQNGSITLSTYSNGKSIVFNYTEQVYDYKGTIVNPNTYVVLEGGSK